MSAQGDVTQILSAVSKGDRGAVDDLLPIVYDELIDDTISEHRRILEAIRARDASAAGAAMQEHLELTRQGLRALLSQGS